MKHFHTAKTPLSVLTWNQLAGCLGDSHWFPYVQPKHLEFGYRQNQIVSQIKKRIDSKESLDIFTIVEVDNYWICLKNTFFKMGFDSVYQKIAPPCGW